jgi:hypothetical protein
MASSSPTPPPAPSPGRGGAVSDLIARLGSLRARIRRIAFLSGVGRWILLAVAALAAFFLADWFLDLPLAVRRFVRLGLLDRPAWLGFLPWALLLGSSVVLWVAAARHRSASAALFAFGAAGLAGILAWAAVRFLWSPLRVPLPDEDLALGVERRFRRLNDRLPAALDFDRELSAPTRGESREMMAAVVEEAEREARGIEFGQVASSRRATRRLAAAAVVLVAFGTLLLAVPATAALWARRALLLEDVAWPQATQIVAVVRSADGVEREHDPRTPYVAALGQSLTVVARAKGRVPSEVEILDRVALDGPAGKPLAHRMRPVGDGSGLFEHEFRDVRGDFTFTFRGGDDRDEVPSYAVSVRVPPRVVGIAADLAFPEYLKLPPRRVEGGTLTVPEGTRVAMSFDADAPVAKATAWIGDDPVAVEGGTEGRGPWRFSFEAKKTTRYRLGITTPDGRENEAATDTYEVTVEMDTPPHSEWVWPGATMEASPAGRVPLFVRTTDDHGIASLEVEVLVGAATEPLRLPLGPRTKDAPDAAGPAAANDLPYGAPAILSYLPLEIATLADAEGKPLAAGARVRLRAVATDFRGQQGGGEWRAIDVSRSDEIERRLAGVRATLKSELLGVRADQRHLRELSGGLVRGAAGDSDRAALREIQFKQGKVRSDVDRSARGLASLFNAYVYGRLGAPVPTEKILALLDRRHRETFARRADAAAATPDDLEVFPWSLYREVVDARREKAFFDTGILDKLVSVLAAAADLADGFATEAYAASVEAAGRGGATEVAALVAAQDRVLKGLDAALAAMDEWQSLTELTLILRRLVQDQETLDEQIRTKLGGPGR